MRILITGSRTYTDKDNIRNAIISVLDQYDLLPKYCTLVHGGASGADTLAGNIWDSLAGVVEVHQADWNNYGKKAGTLRNKEMVDKGADICLAFPDENSVGTWDCIKRASRAGIPVNIR